MKFIGIIPARYGSTRLPGKPLLKIGPKSIIQHVYERSAEVMDDVLVATDDERIMQEVEAFGGRAVMTSPHHSSGTDRVREAYVVSGSDADFVINIQGDEPFVAREHLEVLKEVMTHEEADIATLGYEFPADTGYGTLSDPNKVKIVRAENGRALYFSRSVVPHLRGTAPEEYCKRHSFLHHLGLYAFRSEVLLKVADIPMNPLERAESLEQLRWLEAGYRITVALTDKRSMGVDTMEDLAKAREYWEVIGRQECK